MEYRYLGNTGLKVSALCLGTMQFGWTADEATSHQVLDAAFDAGINFIDTADVYSRWIEGNPGGVAETIIGNWLKKTKIPRDQIVLATKVRAPIGDGPNDEGLSRFHIMNSVEASLKRLGVDEIDLYQAHWVDLNTPIDETLRAFDDLVHQGKVRYIGASNFPAWRMMQALWTSDKLGLARFDCVQPHYNLVHREEFERELEEVCRVYGIGVIPYSPLAGGFLTGKYRQDHQPESARLRGVSKYFNQRNWDLIELMDKMGKEKGVSISQIAIGWLLANPVISSPIIGPRNLEQLEDNLGSIRVQLSPEEIQLLDNASAWN